MRPHFERIPLCAVCLILSVMTSCETVESIFTGAQSVAKEAIARTEAFVDENFNTSSQADTEVTGPTGILEDGETKNDTGRTIPVVAPNRSRFTHDFDSVIDVNGYRISALDGRVREAPRTIRQNIVSNPAEYLPKLAKHFASLSEDSFVVAKLIHDWIADNIAYDTASFFAGTVRSKSVYETVQSRKAVCQGYSELFQFMADSAGLMSEVVSGYARGIGFSPLEWEDFSDSNHAWNAVWIDGAWYLLDCTWDAGGAVGRTFRKSYSTGYLFLEPERMIFTHFPEREAWQLLETPLAADAVARMPGYRGDWFGYDLPVLEGIGKHNTVEGLGLLKIDTPEFVDLSGQLVTSANSPVDSATFSQKVNDETEFYIAAPDAGDFLLQIFAKSNGESRSELVLQLGIHSEESASVLLPTVFSPFIDDKCCLNAPLGIAIVRGNQVIFDIDLPGYVRAYLSDGNARFPLDSTGDGDRFIAEIAIPACRSLTLYASKNSSGSLDGILQFPVVDT
jgi:hypothetical protein